MDKFNLVSLYRNLDKLKYLLEKRDYIYEKRSKKWKVSYIGQDFISKSQELNNLIHDLHYAIDAIHTWNDDE